jgi:SAM-dependent methyltransferase
LEKKSLFLEILRQVKKLFNWMILPDSIAILKARQESIRQKIYKELRESEMVLDVGSGGRPVSGFKKVVTMDFDLNCPVDVHADLHHLPFSEQVFDLVWMGGVLEHVRSPQDAINGIWRILKRKGYIYIEIPFFQKVHGAPHDYQRFTAEGLETLCHNFSKIDCGILCGPSSTFSHILRTYLALCLSFNNKYLEHFFYYYILGWLTFPIKYLDLILFRYRNADTIPFAFYYLGKKI